jgi:hypothetical protein
MGWGHNVTANDNIKVVVVLQRWQGDFGLKI